MATRKKWKITFQGSDGVQNFRSESATYDWLREFAKQRQGDAWGDVNRHATVWMAERHHNGEWGDWQRYEDHDLSEWQ